METARSNYDPTNRFTDRAAGYAKFRPAYPPEVIGFLKKTFGLSGQSTVADIGSGTGIFTAQLLDAGIRVVGVEPNAAMRDAAERQLGEKHLFTSVDGRSEATGLADSSVDLITVAQAFHWMEPAETKKEFIRILREPAQIALIWNLRQADSAFSNAFDHLKKRFGEAHNNAQRANEYTIKTFFEPQKTMDIRFAWEEVHTLASLEGQLLSSSYVPLNGAAGFTEMIGSLHGLFEQFQQAGQVQLSYETRVYYTG